MKDFETFSQLHFNDELLLMGNVWDVNSAKIFEANGFKAIATSSAALANAMGYEDGEQLPFEVLLETVKRINKAVSIPLSVDMERGYSETIPGILQHMEALYHAGAVGINIEDSLPGEKLRSVSSFQKIISSIAEQGVKKKMPLFINARTDAFLLKDPNALNETLARAKAYQAAGAHGIFVPYLCEIPAIEKIVDAITLPVSVFFAAGLPDFKALSKAGVKRVSMGTSLFKYMNNTMEKLIATILQEQSAGILF